MRRERRERRMNRRDIALVVFVLAAALAGFALELTWSDSGARPADLCGGRSIRSV